MGKLDFSTQEANIAAEGVAAREISSGLKIENYWPLLELTFKPKANKILFNIELGTRSKQNNFSLNEWITKVHNLAEMFGYGDFKDRIIRDLHYQALPV